MIKIRLQKDEIFQSHELSLVAALLAWDFSTIAIDKIDSKKVTFFFQKTPELNEAVQSFWNGTKTVSPIKYFNALREAKARIYGS